MEPSGFQLSDLPLKQEEDDRLHFGPLVRTLMGLTIQKKNPTPLVVVVDGPQGSGKTSLLQMVRDTLDRHRTFIEKTETHHRDTQRPCKTFWFNARKYSRDDSLIPGLLLEMTRELEHDPALWEAALRETDPKALIQDFTSRIYDLPLEKRTAVLEEYVGFLRKLINQFCTGNPRMEGDQQGVFLTLVDDLDGCSPSQAVQLLDFLNLFMNVPGCLFFIGSEMKRMREAVRSEFQESQKASDGAVSAYLQKVVQLHVQIPPLDAGRIRSFIEALCGADDHLRGKLRGSVLEVFLKSGFKTPRRLKRSLNHFLFEEQLMDHPENESDQTRIAKWSVIRSLDEEVYDQLMSDGFFLVAWESYTFWKTYPGEHQGFDWNGKSVYWDEWARWRLLEEEEMADAHQDSDTLKIWVSHHPYFKKWETFYGRWKDSSWLETAQFLTVGMESFVSSRDLDALITGKKEEAEDAAPEPEAETEEDVPTVSGYAIKPGADLAEAKLNDTDLSNAQLAVANLQKAFLSRANLTNADLTGANLSGALLNEGMLSYTQLSRADLKKINLQDAYLGRADLHHADLRDANLQRTNFREANLKSANLAGANLERASLMGVNLKDANLKGAKLKQTNLRGANLTGAQFEPEEMVKAANLRSAKFDAAPWDEIAKLMAQ